jgi:tight adherence protein B
MLGGGGVVLILGVVIALATGGGSQIDVDKKLEEFAGSGGGGFVDTSAETTKPKVDVADRMDKAISGWNSGFIERIRIRIAKADLKLRVVEYMGFLAASSIGVGAAGYFFGGMFGGLVGLVVGAQIPRIYANMAANTRIKTFEGQLGDTLNLWVNALRSGYSVLQGMEAIASELPPPISKEFERILQEMRLGINMETALANSLRRVPSEDFDFIVTAINVQRETGGNLAEILDIISFTIRERVRIKGEIQTLTAQGRASGWVITGLPVALGLAVYMLNPEYIMELFVTEEPFVIPGVLPCGWLVAAFTVMMVGAGGYAIKQIVDIEI